MDLEQQIKIAVEGCGVYLYDIVNAREHDDNIYRVSVTSSEGISLDKCAEISRMISPILDINEPMKGKYKLEVSSPGIERKLLKKEHFLGSIGAKIKGKEFTTETFKGKLISIDGETYTFESDDKDTFKINYDDILSASTYYDWTK